MTKILIVALITLFATQVWAVNPEKLICDALKAKVEDKYPPYEICSEVIKQFTQYDAGIFTSTCNDVINRMSSSVDRNVMNNCRDQFGPVTKSSSTEGDDIIRVPVGDAAPIPQESSTISSTAMDKCQEDQYSSYCSIKSTIELPDLNSIMNSAIFDTAGVSRRVPAVYTKEKCDCFEKSVHKNFTFEKRIKFDNDLSAEKKRVNDLIFNAAGKKIINAFAANLEDINFYKTNNVQAIGGDQSANELQCTDIADFKKVIMEECNKNQIRNDIIQGRTESLLGAFGDFKNVTTIEGKFKQLQEEVLNAQLDPSKLVPGGPKSYSRREYDKSRFGIYQKREEVKFMSELTDAVMDDQELSKIIETELDEGKRPGHAIFKLVSDESNEKVKTLLSRIVRKHRGEGFYKNLDVVLKTENQDDLHNFMISTYDLAADMHPGLKAIFRSPELFRRTHSQMEKNNNGHDLIAELDRDPQLLKTFFQRRCDGMKAQFAEALCYREENLTDLANKEDLNKLLSVTGQISPVMKDAILCRMPDNNKDSNSIFTKLAFNIGDKLMMADYFKRKVNVNGGPASRFDRFAMAATGGGSDSRYLSEMSDFRSDLRKPSTEYAAFDQIAAERKIENIKESTAVQPMEKIIDQPQVSQGFTNNYAASSAIAASTDKEINTTSKDHKDPKTMLRDFLADEENRSDVERHLSNVSSKDQEELARLKEEIAADKEKILALLQESERLKLRGYEERVNQAEAKLTQPQVQNKAGPIRKNIDNDEETFSTSGNIASSVQGPAPKDVSGNSSTSSTSSSTGSNGRGSSGAQRSLASLNSSLSTATNGLSSTSSDGSSERAEIIIQSSGTQDLSKEVISYVQKTEPDVEILKKLKNAGMTFKYKVVENGIAVEKELKVDYASLSKEAKQFLDQKIAVKEAKRNYSYNTLRLMLGLKAQKQL